MPDDIINKFKDQYGKKAGEKIYYATANKQGRDPETFKKESSMEGATLEQLEKELEEEMAGLNGALAPAIVSTPAAPIVPPTEVPPMGAGIVPPCDAPAISLSPSPIAAPGLPETVPGETIPPATLGAIPPVIPPVGAEPPPEGGPIMEKKDKKEIPKVPQGSPKNDGGPTTKPSKQVHKSKKDKEEKPKHKPDWKKFDESVNMYLAKTSRNSDIGVNTLEKIWNECVEAQTKGEYSKGTRKFWLEVKSNFDRKVNEIFLQEAKKKMTERQKMNVAIESFLEHVAKDKYVEAKAQIKEMAQACVNSMISERKVQYQKTLAEEIAKKVREAK